MPIVSYLCKCECCRIIENCSSTETELEDNIEHVDAALQQAAAHLTSVTQSAEDLEDERNLTDLLARRISRFEIMLRRLRLTYAPKLERLDCRGVHDLELYESY